MDCSSVTCGARRPWLPTIAHVQPLVSVLIPWRRGAQDRERSFRVVKHHWLKNHPTYRIVIRDSGGEPFSRACSINMAAQSEPDAQVFVIADADVVPVPAQVEAAVELALQAPGIVQPFDRYIPLHKWDTAEVWDRGVVPDVMADRPIAHWECISGCLVLSRESWETVGGFDERFRGWGYEDSAFDQKMASIVAPRRSVPGPAWHLAHVGFIPDAAVDPQSQANRALFEQYQLDYPCPK